MPWKVQILIERPSFLVTAGEHHQIETSAQTAIAALAQAVAGILPAIGAAAPDLYRAFRRARYPGAYRSPQQSASPPGEDAVA